MWRLQTRIERDGLEEADLILKKVRKLQRCLNTIKANHAFSNKEEKDDLERLRNANASKDELILIQKGWKLRRELTSQAIEKLEGYMKDNGGEEDGKNKVQSKSKNRRRTL